MQTRDQVLDQDYTPWPQERKADDHAGSVESSATQNSKLLDKSTWSHSLDRFIKSITQEHAASKHTKKRNWEPKGERRISLNTNAVSLRWSMLWKHLKQVKRKEGSSVTPTLTQSHTNSHTVSHEHSHSLPQPEHALETIDLGCQPLL